MIDIPSGDFEENKAGPNFEIGQFDTKEEAIAFTMEKLKADSQGRINLITEINCDPEDPENKDEE